MRHSSKFIKINAGGFISGGKKIHLAVKIRPVKLTKMLAEKNSSIKNFLKDKNVFVTGGFGFVGKLLVEKLLKNEVKKIYLMARSKKGKSIEERFKKFLNEPVSEFFGVYK
jgi:fatty acyl-CoA reductase